MTDEEADRIVDFIKVMGPDHLQQVDKQFDKFISTIGTSLNAFAEAHRAELAMLGKTLVIVCTDDIVKRNQGIPIGAISVIGSDEDVAALYRALGTELKERGILEDEER